MKKCINGVYVEMTAEEIEALKPTIDEAKEDKLNSLNEYDKSNSVDEFFINGNTMWIDVDLRNKLRNVIAVERAKGEPQFTEWHNGIPFTFSCDMWEYLLTEVEHYAYQCLNVTEQHKANIKALTYVDDVLSYDYTVGYPSKLTFNI